MQKQKLQNPTIDTPKLETSFFEPDPYVELKATDHFIELSKLELEESKSFADAYLKKFEEVFKLAVQEALTRGLESVLLERSKIDTAKSLETLIPSSDEQMSKREEFERNVAAFKAMEKDLENDPKFRGKFVVLYKGQLVDSGTDRAKLLSEAYRKYGYVSLIVHKVGERRVMRAYSPRYMRHA